ncbi:poliovirus receptor homolog isoform X2 [Poecilia reticulata]|uniref:Poliovirus receptor homolog n=1 Tax=Poecilia reticulata TaxID=8081 RepID=A0A3P9MV83_POERE|nr:PREDICTED: poliovirus receptor homolog isoform X2 [Poecilia reticulata]
MIFASFSLLYGVLMSHTLLLLMFALVRSRDARAQDADGSITVDEGGTIILPCKLTQKLSEKDNVEQISWQRKTKGKPDLDNFYTITKDDARPINGGGTRFKFIGTFAEHNGTLELSNATVLDTGTYSCIFSVFPSGYPTIYIKLTVRVPKQTSVHDTRPTLGNKEVPLATCTASGFNPPATVSWQTEDGLKDKVRWTSNSTLQISDTTTTVSTLFGKPTKEINRNKVQCVISFEGRNKTLDFDIQIYYPPLNASIKKQPEGLVFTCEAEGNPNPTITWSRSGDILSPSVLTQGALLTFVKESQDLAGLYQCEANNTYGSYQSFLYVGFSGTSSTTGWIFFCILLLIIVAAGIAAFLHKHGFFKLPRFLRRDREAVRTSSPDEAANEAAEL